MVAQLVKKLSAFYRLPKVYGHKILLLEPDESTQHPHLFSEDTS
jgi:hypothetical protein